MTLDRACGLLMAAFGALLLFLVIPDQVEAVDYGWMRPKTLPNILAVGLVLFGLLQAAVGGGGIEPGPGRAALLRAAGFLAFAAVAVTLMDRLGFAWVAPAMTLVVMLALGERRPLWLGIGVLALPGLIWLVVVALLGRTLPG